MAPAAYWASWADALLGCAGNYMQLFEAEAGDGAHCLAEAAYARCTLQDQGWSACPTWRMLLDGARDWPHGWQYHASWVFTVHSCDRVLLPSLPPSSRALLRSQAGPHAGARLIPIPCDKASSIPPQGMQWPCGVACACPCLFPPAASAPTQHVVVPLTLAATMPSLFARRAKVVKRAWAHVAPHCSRHPGRRLPPP